VSCGPGDIKDDVFDLIVDDQWLSVTQAVPGAAGQYSRRIHCETYPDGIAFPPNPGYGHINHYEPWPLPAKTQDDIFTKWSFGGGRTALHNNDRVRVYGRLVIDNGHQDEGAPWLELHPFDYTNIIDISQGIAEVWLAAVAPLYSDENYAGKSDGPGNVNSNTMQLTNEVHANIPLLAPSGIGEQIIENATGQAPGAVRSLSFENGVLSAHIRVQALPSPTADVFAQRSVFAARYFAVPPGSRDTG
jgi:hypothetical protein